ILVMSGFLTRYQHLLPRRAHLSMMEKPVPSAELRRHITAALQLPAEQAPSFSVIDYLQLAAMGMRSMALEVDVDGEPVGCITGRGGEVWSAVDREGDGEAAFGRLVFATGARAVLRPIGAAPVERNIHGSCESLLLEAARRLDEARKAAEEDEPEIEWVEEPE